MAKNMFKRLLTIEELDTAVDNYDAKNGIIKETRGKYDVADDVSVKGLLVVFDKKISLKLKGFLSRFQNVKITYCTNRYAPEIKHDVVFIGDSKWR